mgnify:CR=1 FL=1
MAYEGFESRLSRREKTNKITGNQEYAYQVSMYNTDLNESVSLGTTDYYSSRSKATDAAVVLAAKFKSSQKGGAPVNVRSKETGEVIKVTEDPRLALEAQQATARAALAEYEEVGKRERGTGARFQTVTKEQYDTAKANYDKYIGGQGAAFSIGANGQVFDRVTNQPADMNKYNAVKNWQEVEHAKVAGGAEHEALKKQYADVTSQLKGLGDWTPPKVEQPTTTRTAATTGSTGAPQTGSTGAPTPTTGETYGGTGALQTTQTTPSVTTSGTTTGYTQPAPTAVDPTTGTYSVPTQTGGLSALPPSTTYATRPAGTPGYVQESLLTPSTSGTGPTTYDQWMQQTQATQQALEEQQAAQQQQSGYIVTMPDGTEQTISYGQPIPVGATIKQFVTGAAKGGMMRKGYAAGGMPEDPMLEAKYRISAMNGYNGPKTNAALNNFANSSEGMKRKFNAIGTVMANKGGLMRQGYQSGGVVQQNDSGQYIVQFPDGTATVFGTGETGKQMAEQYLSTLPSDTGTSVGITGSTDTTITSPTATTLVEGDEAVTDPAATPSYTDPDPFAQQYSDLLSGTLAPIQSSVSQVTPQAADFIPLDAGQAAPVAPFAEAAKVETTAQAALPAYLQSAQMQPVTAADQVQQLTAGTQAAQGQVAPEAQVQAAQQLTTSVAGMEAAQGTATMVNSPAAREIQAGELISGVADAEKAALFNEQIQAATATPSKQATVAGQLEGLMQQFEGGETPAWAAGSMRTAMATLSARGLGASSMAGQAVIQATMEAALPIAQMDAQVQAQFEGQNLSNRQQRAMLAAQQRATFLGMEFDQAFQSRVQNSARIGDIANMNFTAEQNIALENSRAANTMNLSNLNNRQAMVMAEAAALSQLDTQNLNNRQQAAVQNAQNFMQMDMTNLANEQQTAMFKSQQNIQALFTDQAAENASAQFNAANENQTNQFFANLSSQTSQFNASQQNAMDQFNVNSVNALREFNSEIQQQRDLFNAQNGLVIAQSNAQWRQNIATLNTAAQNQSNSDFAKTINALTATNLDQKWQRERDLMSFVFAASESSADRAANIAIAKLTADEQASLQDNIGKGKLTAIASQAILGKWL